MARHPKAQLGPSCNLDRYGDPLPVKWGRPARLAWSPKRGKQVERAFAVLGLLWDEGKVCRPMREARRYVPWRRGAS